MFWSSPSADLEIGIFLLIVALITSIIIYAVTKKIFASILVISILSNLIFYLNTDSRLFDIYNLKWMVVFTLDIWPYINILLIIIFISFYAHKCYKIKKNK